MDLSIVIPCLNEEDTVGICIDKCLKSLKELGIEGEVIVVDNGSVDNSRNIAIQKGIRVIDCKTKGYGATLREGFANANGTYIMMGDADNSYDFLAIKDFWALKNEDFAMLIGSRFRGGIEKDAMPPLHKYFGTPFLTLLTNILFGIKITDSQCGMRMFRKEALDKIKFDCTGMEFATELTAKISMNHMKIIEIPIKLYKDGRIKGKAHIRPWRDGLRHLFFMLKMRFFYRPNP